MKTAKRHIELADSIADIEVSNPKDAAAYALLAIAHAQIAQAIIAFAEVQIPKPFHEQERLQ